MAGVKLGKRLLQFFLILSRGGRVQFEDISPTSFAFVTFEGTLIHAVLVLDTANVAVVVVAVERVVGGQRGQKVETS